MATLCTKTINDYQTTSNTIFSQTPSASIAPSGYRSQRFKGELLTNPQKWIVCLLPLVKEEEFSEFIFEKEVITSSISIKFVATQSDGIYFYKNDFYNIIAYGRSEEEAKKQLNKKMIFIWDEIISEDDSKLSNGNIKRKNLLKAILSHHEC